MKVYLQQIKKKAKSEGKTCHAKTMFSLEQPIKLVLNQISNSDLKPNFGYKSRFRMSAS